MPTVTEAGVSLARRSPGIVLVMLGFTSIYFIAMLRSGAEASLVTYLTIGFAFLVTLAGIFLLFRELRSFPAPGGESEYSLASASDIEHAVRQLGKNYDLQRRQATQGFVLAGTFMALGILVILTGSIGEMFGLTSAASNLTTVAGTIIETVSVLGLYLFKETFARLNATSDRLYEMWKIFAAFQKAESLPDDRRCDVTVSLINRLVDGPTLHRAVQQAVAPDEPGSGAAGPRG